MSLHVLPPAADEADEAARWYEARQAGLGAQFLDDLIRAYQQIEAQPHLHPQVAPSVRGRDVRRCILRRWAYTIIYEVRGMDVLVVAVAHTSRRPNYWRKRLP